MGATWPGYIQPSRAGGWICAGGGYGVNAYSPKTFFVEPFLDNGINSDQDNAFFGQGAVTAKQTIAGLTAGQSYTLVFDYNYRDGRAQNSSVTPNTGQIDVSWEGSSVKTTEEQPPVDTLSPWPGFRHTKPFYQAFVPITASGETAELQLAHISVVGDETFLVDNVRIIPGTRTPITMTKELVEQTVQAGNTITCSVAASGTALSYRWFVDGVPLVDGGDVSGATTATLTIAHAQQTQSGTYSALVSDGVSVVGSAALITVEAPVVTEVSLTVRLEAGKVVIAWPASATGYRLQQAPALPALAADWTDESTPAVQVGDNWEVQITPTGTQKYYRLIK